MATGSSSIPYPTQLPIAEIEEVIATIRAGDIKTSGAQFAKAIWTIAGFALLNIAGEVQSSLKAVGASGTRSLSNEEACNKLEQLLNAHKESGGNVAQALPPINWKALASWALQILATLIA